MEGSVQQGSALNHGLIKAQLPSLLPGLFIAEADLGAVNNWRA